MTQTELTNGGHPLTKLINFINEEVKRAEKLSNDTLNFHKSLIEKRTGLEQAILLLGATPPLDNF